MFSRGKDTVRDWVNVGQLNSTADVCAKVEYQGGYLARNLQILGLYPRSIYFWPSTPEGNCCKLTLLTDFLDSNPAL